MWWASFVLLLGAQSCYEHFQSSSQFVESRMFLYELEPEVVCLRRAHDTVGVSKKAIAHLEQELIGAQERMGVISLSYWWAGMRARIWFMGHSRLYTVEITSKWEVEESWALRAYFGCSAGMLHRWPVIPLCGSWGSLFNVHREHQACLFWMLFQVSKRIL